jgi:hypothetical protein
MRSGKGCKRYIFWLFVIWYWNCCDSVDFSGFFFITQLYVIWCLYFLVSANRQNVRKIGIILTDGRSTSPTSTINAANAAKAAGVELFSIGYGTDVFVWVHYVADPDISIREGPVFFRKKNRISKQFDFRILSNQRIPRHNSKQKFQNRVKGKIPRTKLEIFC